MGLFTFIIFLLILLLILIIIGTIQEFTLWVVTRKGREFVIMLIPALVALSLFVITTILAYYILLKVFNINTFDIFFSMIMNFEYSFHSFIYMIIGYSTSFLVFIILQAICLKLVNINYKKISDFVKYKILRKKEIKGLGNSAEETEEKASVNLTNNFLPTLPNKKTPFFHYLAASLFSFAILFFSISSLIYLGIMLGEKYII